MTTKTFVVPNISCGHCTSTIELELSDLVGVTGVNADVDSKKVTVSWEEPATWDSIQSLLTEINYPPQQLMQID
ncbi:MAG: heavy-metal-associated domain-containing protein [Candidatus Promineifilaceae bacterium]|jgi:copper chaperone